MLLCARKTNGNTIWDDYLLVAVSDSKKESPELEEQKLKEYKSVSSVIFVELPQV